MGIDVTIESEDGEREAEVLDPEGHFARALESTDIERTVCLRFIDRYGDTVFNQLQIPLFIAEIESLRSRVEATAVGVAATKPLENSDKSGIGLSAAPEAEASDHLSIARAIVAHLDSVLGLARQARSEAHTYLKCCGD